MNPEAKKSKLDTFVTAWSNNAPNATFAGMTLQQFKAAIQPSYDTRKTVADLESQLTVAIDNRDDADDASLGSCDDVLKAIVADKNYGDDSALYEALGYVRKSEKASGLTRNTAAAKAAKAAAKAAKKQG